MNAEPPPNNQYQCEAREPGKPTFEFATPDGEAARAMCDAHGWELIRVYEPGKHSDRAADAAGKGDLPLSKKQVQAVAIEAGKAFRLLDQMDLTEGMAEDDWRRAQVAALVKRSGLSKCQNSHYSKLMRHFKRLQGEKTVPSPSGSQSGEGGDTLERREQLLALIASDLGHHQRRVDHPADAHEWACSEAAMAKGGKIGPGYLLGIARAKNPGCTIADEGALITLPASRLEQLLFTLRNRIAAREGRGKVDQRNKGQKKRRNG
jgi:hypothetical protein